MLEHSVNLATANEEAIKALISEYSLKASVPFLREVGKCLSAEGIAPDEETLRFFDAIYTCATSQSENINISDLYANDEEVIKTFSDLFEKHKYLSDSPVDSISLDDMVHVSSRYFETLGISAPSSVSIDCGQNNISLSNGNGKELLSFSLDTSKPLPYGYEKEKNASDDIIADKDDLFFLVHSDNCCLLENVSKKRIKINGGGILSVISKNALGATVYADFISDICDLVSCQSEKEVIIISKENESSLALLFEEHGVCAHKIAVATDSPVFSIITQNRSFNIRANFLRRIFRYKSSFLPKIPSSSFEPTKYDDVSLDNNSSARLVNKNGHTLSVLLSSNCSFTSGINIALDNIFTLLSKGIDRRNIGMTFKIGYTAEHMSDAVATLLGIYRVSTELCVPEKSSGIELSDKDYVLCCVYAKAEGTMPERFTDNEGSSALLFSFGRFNDTTPPLMPDFSEIRKMCDHVTHMIAEEDVLSAIAVDGSVYKATKKMCSPEVSISLVANNITSSTNAQGLIIQLKDGKKTNAPIIGVIQKEVL